MSNKTTIDCTDFCMLETMPDYLRASHRAANNWGVYPCNGAIRKRMLRTLAEEIVEHNIDGYDHIIND